MPATYHFRPFPKPGETHPEVKPQQTQSETANPQCSCQGPARCRQCRRPERSNRSSQTVLPSIKEEADPVPRSITPKAIREQRRAVMRVSVSDVFNQAVGDEDYFTFYHPTAFARSPSASSESTSLERRSRRLGSASRSNLSKSTTEQVLPPIPSLAAADSTESLEEEEPDDTRRDS